MKLSTEIKYKVLWEDPLVLLGIGPSVLLLKKLLFQLEETLILHMHLPNSEFTKMH